MNTSCALPAVYLFQLRNSRDLMSYASFFPSGDKVAGPPSGICSSFSMPGFAGSTRMYLPTLRPKGVLLARTSIYFPSGVQSRIM